MHVAYLGCVWNFVALFMVITRYFGFKKKVLRNLKYWDIVFFRHIFTSWNIFVWCVPSILLPLVRQVDVRFNQVNCISSLVRVFVKKKKKLVWITFWLLSSLDKITIIIDLVLLFLKNMNWLTCLYEIFISLNQAYVPWISRTKF